MIRKGLLVDKALGIGDLRVGTVGSYVRYD